MLRRWIPMSKIFLRSLYLFNFLSGRYFCCTFLYLLQGKEGKERDWLKHEAVNPARRPKKTTKSGQQKKFAALKLLQNCIWGRLVMTSHKNLSALLLKLKLINLIPLYYYPWRSTPYTFEGYLPQPQTHFSSIIQNTYLHSQQN